MKKIFILLTLLFVTYNSFSQSRPIARGATPGELYMTNPWYGIYAPPGPPWYDTLRLNVCHITEHGKKLTLQYDADYFDNYPNKPEAMLPDNILADATPGVVYNSQRNNNYSSLWVSFDSGKNWILREENNVQNYYYSANVEGLVYKGENNKMFKSEDYGYFFSEIDYNPGGSEPGLQNGEGFSIWYSSNRLLRYSNDFGKTFTEFPIDSQFVYGNFSGFPPDVYRGALPGEVYVSSRFPDNTYKVSFSADTGHTFRHVYIHENISLSEYIGFMSDREAGGFYIIRRHQIEDFNPWGWHLKLCIDYYRDYGETLVDTYCHDLHKNYGKTCEPVNNLAAEKITEHSILLTWTEPVSSLPVIAYQIYRNEEFLTSITTTSFLDENLPVGNYEYYVVAHYEMGCVADSSNHVKVEIEVGIDEYLQPNFTVIPNPATNQVTISSATSFHSVEIINFLGQTVVSQSSIGNTATINVSNLNNGVYFVRVGFESGGSVKKLVKQ